MWIWRLNGRLRPLQRQRHWIRSKHSRSNLVIPLGNKRDVLRLETGKLTRFADGSSLASIGNTSVNVTVVSKKTPSSSASFLPLTVDFRQKSAAAGRIPTNYLRRELGPSEREILVSRVIDRSIRPLFPKGYYHETQCVANVLATDGKYDSDVISLNGASAALSVSNVPWNGPIGAVRIGTSLDRRQLVLNPTRSEREESSLNLLLVGNKGGEAVVIEASADVIDKILFLEAIEFGLEQCSSIAKHIEEWSSSLNVCKRTLSLPLSDEENEVTQSVELLTANKLRSLYQSKKSDKIERDNAMFAILENAIPSLKESFPNLNTEVFNNAFYYANKKVISELILDDGHRPDGRKVEEIRPISCEVGLHAPLHGSALFQRGQTQVLCTVALDSVESSLKNDQMSTLTGGVKEKNFFLHYEFPSYATNDISRSFSAGRRELGHGALAEKALMPLIPKNYPFTIRLTSEVLESNGSSSMATVCGGSLALMDAGVHIKSPAAGVAIGLVSRGNEQQLLLDIIGQEDHAGDMDFKIAGTDEGITALQLDIKIPGLSLEMIKAATHLGHKGIQTILGTMKSCLSGPRIDKSNLPKIDTISVPLNKRSKFIGPSGYNIRRITSQTGVRITPGDKEDSWTVFAHNSEAMDEAMELINASLKEEKDIEFTFGALYKVNVLDINSSGIQVQIHPAYPMVFIPNSQLSATKVSHPSALDIQVGQELLVKCYGRDPVTGHLRLSRKALTVAQSAAVKSLPSSANRSEVIPVPEKSSSQDKRLFHPSLQALSNERSTRSKIARLEEELRDLTGKMKRVQMSRGDSLLSECYLPSLYERYKNLISQRNELSESLSPGRGHNHHGKEDMSPSSDPAAVAASLFSDLVDKKFYRSIITAVKDNGFTVSVIDEVSRVAINNVFVPIAWITKKSAEKAAIGVVLSLQYRGLDSITQTPRLVEPGSFKRKAVVLKKKVSFKTFKPTELFKLDVWSSSLTKILGNEFQRFDAHISLMQNLKRREEFSKYFKAQIEYCNDLRRLVSGPLSKTISLEIEKETKEIYCNLDYILGVMGHINRIMCFGTGMIGILSKLVESPGKAHMDSATGTLYIFSNLLSELKIVEEHFKFAICDQNRVVGRILLEFEKNDIHQTLQTDVKVIGESLAQILDEYAGHIRRNNVEFLCDWVDYEELPTFAFERTEIYEMIKDDGDVDAIQDVRLLYDVVKNVPMEKLTLVMNLWMNPEFRAYVEPRCHDYIAVYDQMSEKKRTWWKNQESITSDEASLEEKYEALVRLKNCLKIACLELRFFEEIIRIVPLKPEEAHLNEVRLLIKKVSGGDETLIPALSNAVETLRSRIKDSVIQRFSSALR